MPIHPNKKSLFIHIPKCAGSSIEDVFNMKTEELFYKKADVYNLNGITYAPQHLILEELTTMVDNYEELFKFTFVRNPYDRFISEYFYNTKVIKFDKLEFKKWYNNFFKEINTDHKLTQTKYLTIDGKISVDFIGRFENINDDFNTLLGLLGLPTDIKLKHNRANSNRRDTNYLNYLDCEDIKFINNLFYEDFINFMYDMIESC